MTTILYFCSRCGAEVEGFCREHPRATIDSVLAEIETVPNSGEKNEGDE